MSWYKLFSYKFIKKLIRSPNDKTLHKTSSYVDYNYELEAITPIYALFFQIDYLASSYHGKPTNSHQNYVLIYLGDLFLETSNMGLF